jgi:hypothetical protein
MCKIGKNFLLGLLFYFLKKLVLGQLSENSKNALRDTFFKIGRNFLLDIIYDQLIPILMFFGYNGTKTH